VFLSVRLGISKLSFDLLKILLFALQIVRLMRASFEQFGHFFGRVCVTKAL